ncbi:transporter [uncultured Tenacibaculum sp.]|uniref:transporter n=1 Tax=uncultured Tenacibaculum sp. TaxID=174713 RepID=UPI00261D58F1|nr:transporter [uncultured Tenacibaculum sp.]
MIKKLFLFFAFCSTFIVNAQYTTVINSNRPGYSESPYSVGSGVYQFETSLFFRNINATPTFSNPQALGLDLLFRTSFFSEKLEFNLNTTLQRDKIAFKNVFESSYNQTGLSNLTLGAKYLVYTPKYDDKKKEIRSWKARHSFDWKRWIPHVGVYAGLNFGSVLTDFHERGGISPKVGVLLQNEFSDKLRVISNLYYDYIGSDFSEFSYIITGTYNFNDYWSGFAELQGTFEKYEKKSNLGFGAAYLYSENLQLNATARVLRQQDEVGFYTGIGVSYRINRHQDEFVEMDEFGNKIVDQEETKYDENKGFFGRLFSKVKKLFKGKDKQTIVIDDGEKKEEITIEKPKRQRQKSLVDIIAKEDKKLKKKTTKAEKKAAKKAKKKAEKDAKNKVKERLKLEKNIKKEKEKEAKRKEKERLKLEKEIKKLEDDLKKEEEKEKKKDK